jgi:DNA-binding transcriptional LysR family regulator
MGLEDLRISDVMTFLAVRRCGSITGAARELEVTPSQISKSVTRLERHLRLKLLVRNARGVGVSDAGLRILPHLEEIVSRLLSLPAGLHDDRPELTLVAPSYLLNFVLPAVVDSQPHLRLRALQMPPALIRHFAGANLFEMALCNASEQLPQPWISQSVGMGRKGLFASPRVAAELGPGKIDPAVLKGRAFICPIYTSNGQFVPVDDGCPLGQDRMLGHQVQTIGLALDIAAQGDQFVFGPVMAARRQLDDGSLVEIEVEGWNVQEPIELACNADRVLANVQRAVLSTLRERLAPTQTRRPRPRLVEGPDAALRPARAEPRSSRAGRPGP